ncbi:Serine dehydrogenase proteinase [Gimesia maris]|uniref:SDH family Clp fold serine proteinase n=1 Tax=Gimesia maris TaxID=122 RepID=UPI0011879444|nr:serine dehydrogenasease [Gimesia maris]QDT77941.1 Serine dehydrogenase proteinase [Gimesia maris]
MSCPDNKPSVGGVIEAQLDDQISQLESEVDGDVLSIIGPIMSPIDDHIREAVEYRAEAPLARRKKKLVVLLETHGGIIEVAQRIVETLRHHYIEVDFIVSSHAMSAGTVLVLSGDAIYMDYYSILGPIDPQIQKNSMMLPALGYLESFQELVDKSARGQLTTAELSFMNQKFDPAELYYYKQAKDLSITLLEEWLVKYKFKNWKTTQTSETKVTTEMRKKRAREIAEDLNNTKNWYSHGRGISMEVLRSKIKLQIDDFGETPSLKEAIRTYHTLLSHYMAVQGQKGVIHVNGKYSKFC